MAQTLDTPLDLAAHVHRIRGRKVMLDADLAALYGVETKRLNEQVRRNAVRFPEAFMFQLSDEETVVLRSQFATSKPRRGGRRYNPYVFTEHGAVMLASVLNSERAVAMSLLVVRTFVALRDQLSAHSELKHKLDELERKVSSHDQALAGLIDAIRQLMNPALPAKRGIGFSADISNKPLSKGS
jgi:hypothetical protein